MLFRSIEEARDLLTRAVEQGSDTADVILDRLNRVGSSASHADLRLDPPPPRSAVKRRRAMHPGRLGGWAAAALITLVVGTAMLLGGLPIGSWLSGLYVAAPAPSTPVAVNEPLPVVRASETALAQARSLRAGGRLRDALRVLDRIDMADPFHAEADRLRADVQRDLFASAGIPPSVPAAAGSRP